MALPATAPGSAQARRRDDRDEGDEFVGIADARDKGRDDHRGQEQRVGEAAQRGDRDADGQIAAKIGVPKIGPGLEPSLDAAPEVPERIARRSSRNRR